MFPADLPQAITLAMAGSVGGEKNDGADAVGRRSMDAAACAVCRSGDWMTL